MDVHPANHATEQLTHEVKQLVPQVALGLAAARSRRHVPPLPPPVYHCPQLLPRIARNRGCRCLGRRGAAAAGQKRRPCWAKGSERHTG